MYGASLSNNERCEKWCKILKKRVIVFVVPWIPHCLIQNKRIKVSMCITNTICVMRISYHLYTELRGERFWDSLQTIVTDNVLAVQYYMVTQQRTTFCFAFILNAGVYQSVCKFLLFMDLFNRFDRISNLNETNLFYYDYSHWLYSQQNTIYSIFVLIFPESVHFL